MTVSRRGHPTVSFYMIELDIPVQLSRCRRTVVVQPVGEKEEVVFVSDLREDHAGAVDVLRVFEIGATPGVGDVDIAGEVACGFDI